MEEGRGVPETLVDKLEELKKKQEDFISILKDIKQVLLELKELDDEEVGDENESVDLIKISQGSSALCSEVRSEAKKTKPKPYYTMATLLNDLTGVAKYAKDPKIKALLQEKDKDKKGENGGIGTPATRSQHIKNLIEKEYIS